MVALSGSLRRQLESVCVQARDLAESAARSALQKRAVDASEPHPHFTAGDKQLRNRLRSRGRQVGDVRYPNKTQSIDQLGQELAYEYWHRMLFARFLAENQLLMHPDGVAVSLEECDELARSEGVSNGFVLAARYASKMLPQVFRTDDVLLEIEFAPEHRQALEKLVLQLPKEAFLADDSLGWAYQFWQSKKKEEVNKGGKPIDGRTLPAVTQLFTEEYMVQFLLQNTIGAWWCSLHGIKGNPDERGIPNGIAPVEMPFLRWREDRTPAAGSFDGWPTTLAEVRLLDPCAGSGHFLVGAFSLLVPLRMHDGMTPMEACNAVLSENLFGLELDPRCTQIAAFSLAVAAWKYPGTDGHALGYRELPPLNIACTGIGPQANEDEWLRLAEQSGMPMSALSREPILNGLRKLHSLFSNAPTLGSLIDPNQLSADLISADYETLQPYLGAALTAEISDEEAHERAIAAAGMVKAAELLAGEYTLVITNVPYLGRSKQSDSLSSYCDSHYAAGKHDLSTVFWLRCLDLLGPHGTAAIVLPQNWMFLGTYTGLRRTLVENRTINMVVKLGPAAFQDMNWWAANTSLVISSHDKASTHAILAGLDVSHNRDPAIKGELLKTERVGLVSQKAQVLNPDCRIQFEEPSSGTLLDEYADGLQGISTADLPRFARVFWELPIKSRGWEFFQGSADETILFGGRESVLNLKELERAADVLGAAIRGRPAWGRKGVVLRQMRHLPATLYTGEPFDTNVAIILPKKEEFTAAIWAFCSSSTFHEAVRKIDQKTNVTNATLVKVPFDLSHWQAVADKAYPDGLPELESDVPTQWIFHGWPEASTNPLQVAVTRLLGWQWPAELKVSISRVGRESENSGLSKRAQELVLRCGSLSKFADSDGIVCIPAVRTESSADERVVAILQAVYGPKWSDSVLHDLQAIAGCKSGTTLEDWLRNYFAEQHSKCFHHRPFIWQVWDGRKDGFSCLLNYHKLDYKRLDNLTHSYLESWIKKQAGDAKTGKAGADLRMAAAQGLQEKLKLILAGEPPYDIFVRWKPLHEQPIGWNPDLNDGVRANIRPFVEAGILRKNPNIKWTKDRGNEPERDKSDFPWFWDGRTFVGDRVNDIHLTNAEKQAARDARGKK